MYIYDRSESAVKCWDRTQNNSYSIIQHWRPFRGENTKLKAQGSKFNKNKIKSIQYFSVFFAQHCDWRHSKMCLYFNVAIPNQRTFGNAANDRPITLHIFSYGQQFRCENISFFWLVWLKLIWLCVCVDSEENNRKLLISSTAPFPTTETTTAHSTNKQTCPIAWSRVSGWPKTTFYRVQCTCTKTILR